MAIHELPLQIVLPEQRINLYSDRQELLEELNRVFPDKADAIKMFYNRVDEIAEIAMPLFLPVNKDDKGIERVLRLSKEKARHLFYLLNTAMKRRLNFYTATALTLHSRGLLTCRRSLFYKRLQMRLISFR